jgi:hypothetical protein
MENSDSYVVIVSAPLALDSTEVKHNTPAVTILLLEQASGCPTSHNVRICFRSGSSSGHASSLDLSFAWPVTLEKDASGLLSDGSECVQWISLGVPGGVRLHLRKAKVRSHF